MPNTMTGQISVADESGNDKLFRRLKQLVQMGVLSAFLQCANTVAVNELSPVKDSATLFWLACRNVLEGVAHTVACEFATGPVTRSWGVLVPNLAWDAYRAFITKDWQRCVMNTFVNITAVTAVEAAGVTLCPEWEVLSKQYFGSSGLVLIRGCRATLRLTDAFGGPSAQEARKALAEQKDKLIQALNDKLDKTGVATSTSLTGSAQADTQAALKFVYYATVTLPYNAAKWWFGY